MANTKLLVLVLRRHATKLFAEELEFGWIGQLILKQRAGEKNRIGKEGKLFQMVTFPFSTLKSPFPSSQIFQNDNAFFSKRIKKGFYGKAPEKNFQSGD